MNFMNKSNLWITNSVNNVNSVNGVNSVNSVDNVVIFIYVSDLKSTALSFIFYV